MTKDILFEVLEKLITVSRKNKIKIVIMGGIATSLFARPRATYDIDGIVALKQPEIEKFLVLLKKSGFKFDDKQPVKSIAGLPFISFYYLPYKTYLDIFIAQNEFQEEVVKRAKTVKLNKLTLSVVTPEDLILIKLKSGRNKDIEDVREIILENKNKLDFKYLKHWAKWLNVEMFLNDEIRSLSGRDKIE